MIWSCGSSEGSWKEWLIFKASNSRCTSSLPRAGRQCSLFLISVSRGWLRLPRVLSLKSLKCNSWPCLFRINNPAAFERIIPEVLAAPTLYCTRWARQQYHVSTEQGLERAHEAPCLLLVRNKSAVTKVSCTIWIDPLVTCTNLSHLRILTFLCDIKSDCSKSHISVEQSSYLKGLQYIRRRFLVNWQSEKKHAWYNCAFGRIPCYIHRLWTSEAEERKLSFYLVA